MTTPANPNIRSRLLIAALLGAVAFLTWETVIRTWDLYRTVPWVDIPGHFLSGMASAALAYWLLQRWRSRRNRTDRSYVLAVLIAIAIAFLWEASEMIGERIWPDPAHLRDVFWWDGFWDVVAGTVGAISAFPLLRLMQQNVKAFKPMDV
jgi:uncharacterized membrane protein YjdF